MLSPMYEGALLPVTVDDCIILSSGPTTFYCAYGLGFIVHSWSGFHKMLWKSEILHYISFAAPHEDPYDYFLAFDSEEDWLNFKELWLWEWCSMLGVLFLLVLSAWVISVAWLSCLLLAFSISPQMQLRTHGRYDYGPRLYLVNGLPWLIEGVVVEHSKTEYPYDECLGKSAMYSSTHYYVYAFKPILALIS